jgi:hypothetical protein
VHLQDKRFRTERLAFGKIYILIALHYVMTAPSKPAPFVLFFNPKMWNFDRALSMAIASGVLPEELYMYMKKKGYDDWTVQAKIFYAINKHYEDEEKTLKIHFKQMKDPAAFENNVQLLKESKQRYVDEVSRSVLEYQALMRGVHLKLEEDVQRKK